MPKEMSALSGTMQKKRKSSIVLMVSELKKLDEKMNESKSNFVGKKKKICF